MKKGLPIVFTKYKKPMKDKQLAIIKDVDYGLRDTNRPCLSFTVYTEAHIGALQIFSVQSQIDEILKDAGAKSIKDLEGKSCWVKCEGNTINFIEMSNI
jgi:hypothetical protein